MQCFNNLFACFSRSPSLLIFRFSRRVSVVLIVATAVCCHLNSDAVLFRFLLLKFFCLFSSELLLLLNKQFWFVMVLSGILFVFLLSLHAGSLSVNTLLLICIYEISARVAALHIQRYFKPKEGITKKGFLVRNLSLATLVYKNNNSKFSAERNLNYLYYYICQGCSKRQV